MFARTLNVVKLVHQPRNGLSTMSAKSRLGSATTPSGSILPEPKKPRFGVLGVICAVATGLFIGATISKNVANFLEENELFVPSDDDDDD